MKIKMKLLSDTIFGNGTSVPGGEDISVLCDENGFPYFKGGTFKGIFGEELDRYLAYTGKTQEEAKRIHNALLGFSGDDGNDAGKLCFSDFTLSEAVRSAVLAETGNYSEEVLDSVTNIRMFTALEDGNTKSHSLRSARCVNKGLVFYSEIKCSQEDAPMVSEVCSMVKWIGSLRNRGFGKVSITAE